MTLHGASHGVFSDGPYIHIKLPKLGFVKFRKFREGLRILTKNRRDDDVSLLNIQTLVCSL